MKLKKLVVAAACAAAAVIATVSLAACSGGAPAPTGTYLSENELTYQNFLPTYNYFFIVSTTQQLDTFDDGTYCLTVTTSSYSNISTGADVPTGSETWNDRGQAITRYYGACTVEVDASDDTLSFVTLSEPTRVAYASYGSVTLDTGNWTEAMTTAATGDSTTTVDAAAYLESMVGAFPEDGVEIMVTLSSCSFEQVEVNWASRA